MGRAEIRNDGVLGSTGYSLGRVLSLRPDAAFALLP